MVVRRWLIVILLLVPLALRAQTEATLEQWVEETGDEAAAGELSDEWLRLRQHPVNLNDTLALERLFFLSPFQRQALRNYILLYGQLLSLKELRFVPGFDSATVALLTEVAVAAPYTPPRRWRLADGEHTFTTALGGTVERADGYASGHYAGDNLRALAVYRYTLYGKVELRLAADKDPGEAWGTGNYVGYHLMVRHLGRLERLIVGRYNLQFGQGLTVWTGLRPFNMLGATPIRYGNGVRPSATFYEEGYQEGLAARVRLARSVSLSAFGSHVDGTTVAGTHLDWRHADLRVGVTLAGLWLDSLPVVRDYVYNQNYFRGQRQLNAGVDVVWRWRRVTLFGEAAVGGNGAPAVIGGVALHVGDGLRMGLTGRCYHDAWQNRLAQPYTLGNGAGERGLTLDGEGRLPLELKWQGSVDVHRLTALRYADYSPSVGEWMRLQLSREWGHRLAATVRYATRLKERNIPNIDSTLYLGEQTMRRQLQGEVRTEWGPWRVAARGVWCHFGSEQGEPQQGWLAGVSARYTRRALQATAAAAWFDVDGYYARIYYNENHLQYAWSIPALTGRGLRGYVLVRYTLGQLTLAAKYTLLWHPGAEAIGSGDARTEGPVRQTWMVQLRWKL